MEKPEVAAEAAERKGPVVTPGPVVSAGPITPEEVAAPEEDEAAKLMGSLIEKLMQLTSQVEGLSQENAQLKRDLGTQDPSAYRRKVDPDFQVPVQHEPLPPGEYAVFRSPFPGFKQVLKRGKTEHYADGDRSVTGPVLAEFQRGVCVLYDPELIEIMRQKFNEKQRMGVVEFVEVKDPELKKAAIVGTRAVVNPKITVDTPLAEVLGIK